MSAATSSFPPASRSWRRRTPPPTCSGWRRSRTPPRLTGSPTRRSATGGSGLAYPDTLAKAAAGISGVDLVIPGHAPVTRWQAFLDYGEFMKAWVSSISEAAKAGRTQEQAMSAFTPAEKFKHYNTTRAKANVEVVYKELGK